MESINLSGFPRENVGKKDAKILRQEGKIPCVLYGGEEQLHFWSYGYDLKQILYSPKTFIIKILIAGETHDAVVQESQFHPISDGILHVDFLELHADKPVKVEIPIEMEGFAPGVRAGGRLTTRMRKLKVLALPANLPDSIKVNIDNLELGKVIRIKEIETENYNILNPAESPVCAVIVPRAARTEAEEVEGEEGEAEEATEGETES